MIDIKELKIGNVVKSFNRNVLIEEISGKGINYSPMDEDYEYSEDDLYPIPITEELLEQLGFFKEEYSICHDFEFKKWIDGYPITINNLSNSRYRDYYIHIDNRVYETILGADIQYLHQLQNAIYFATNNELDVKNIIK